MGQWTWQPAADSGITLRRLTANGIDFELAEAGVDNGRDRLALCLHGFPELNLSWRYQMPMLAAQGWRVWAPNLRGYGTTTRPTGIAAYHLDRLCEDVAALIDASGAREVMLVAHDWGAIIAWTFAIRRIRPLSRLVIMNVPHPLVFQRELKHWRQIRRSWYVYFFQLPWLPERGLTRRGGAAIRRVFRDMAIDKSRFPRELLNLYAAASCQPGAATAMVNYYRANFRDGAYFKAGDGRVDVPTLMIWGEEDTALNIRCTEGTDAYCADFRLERLPQVSHWVQQEAPERVNEIVAAWLSR
ncbi:alpha/beta fold hydrolase [Sphingomonas sp. GlSt437]